MDKKCWLKKKSQGWNNLYFYISDIKKGGISLIDMIGGRDDGSYDE